MIVRLCVYVVRIGMIDKLGPPFAYTLWVAGRVLLVHGYTFRHPVDVKKIGILIKALGRMGIYWPVADRYRQLLAQVYNDYQHGGTLSAELQRRVMPRTVKKLVDMTKNAYDLNFGIASLSIEDSDISRTSANGCLLRHDATSTDTVSHRIIGTPMDGTRAQIQLFGKNIFDPMSPAATDLQV